jgi:hypothetical protein
MTPYERMFLFRRFYAQTRFDLENRLGLLVAALKAEPNLRGVVEIMSLLDQTAKLDRNVLAWRDYVVWWEDRVKARGQENKK